MNLLVQGYVSSERVIVFLIVILQHDPMVMRGVDICSSASSTNGGLERGEVY